MMTAVVVVKPPVKLCKVSYFSDLTVNLKVVSCRQWLEKSCNPFEVSVIYPYLHCVNGLYSASF